MKDGDRLLFGMEDFVPSCAFVIGLDDGVIERGIAHRYGDYSRQADTYHSALRKTDRASSESLSSSVTSHRKLCVSSNTLNTVPSPLAEERAAGTRR